MAAIFRQAQLVAVRKPGQLGSELVLLAEGSVDRHGEAAIDDAHDGAFDPADMVDIGDDAFSDPSGDGSRQRNAPRRHVCGLAGIFMLVLEHEAAEEIDLYALMATPVMLPQERALAECLTKRHSGLRVEADGRRLS
jgi:hypothetical protein